MLFAFYNFGNKSGMRLIFFFKMFKILRRIQKWRKQIKKKFWVLNKIAFELISSNTQFYRERILVIGSQYVNKQF